MSSLGRCRRTRIRTLGHLLGLTMAFAFGASSDPGRAAVAWLDGVVATTRMISVSGSLSFGDVPVGDLRQLTIMIVNSSSATVTVAGLHVTGGLQAHTYASWSGGTIGPGASQPIRIRFAPFAPGPYRGFVTVIGNHASGASTVSISANVIDAPDDDPGNLWRVAGQRSWQLLAAGTRPSRRPATAS